MAVVIEKGKKPLMKNFQKFYPAWILAIHDLNPENRKLAIDNFLKLMPSKEKHPVALHKFSDN